MNNKLKFNETAFFYVAPGFDWEPLMRFSNICNQFFYANLFYTKEDVLMHLNNDLRNSKFLKIVSIKEHEDFDELSHFDLHPQFRQHFQNAMESFEDGERRDYAKAFMPALHEKQWMLEVELERIGLGRKITLFYFTGEGLASYMALSHNGAFPPKVLCTIQTGVLEKANRLMQRFLKRTEKLPLLWVRGSEENIYYSKSDSLGDDKLYSEKGMGFSFSWEVKTSYLYTHGPNQIQSKRFCKGYITKDSLDAIEASPFKEYGNGNKIVQGNLQDILPQTITKKTLVYCQSALRHLLPEKSDLFHISHWDHLLKEESKLSFRDCREFIRMSANMLDFEEVYFTLFGLEDEGELLDGLLKYNYPAKMIAVVKDPMDLYELRELNNKEVA
jgi:hypothetical protein